MDPTALQAAGLSPWADTTLFPTPERVMHSLSSLPLIVLMVLTGDGEGRGQTAQVSGPLTVGVKDPVRATVTE